MTGETFFDALGRDKFNKFTSDTEKFTSDTDTSEAIG